jgi:hypothetical protein
MNDNQEKDIQSILNIASRQLDRYHHHNAIDEVLKTIDAQLKEKPLDKQIKYYETQARNLANTDELIKFYIFICARDELFNFQEITKTNNIVKLFIKDSRVYNSISDMNDVVENEINKAGGYYLYIRKNRDAIKSRYSLGVPSAVKYKEKFLYVIKATHDFEDSLNKAKTVDEINKISEAHRIKISDPFPENEMKIEREIEIPYNIRLFNRLLDKIEELEDNKLKKENIQKQYPSSLVDIIIDIPAIPRVKDKIKGDISVLYKKKVIDVIDKIPNVADIELAIALLDLWNNKYTIIGYDGKKNDLINKNFRENGDIKSTTAIGTARSRPKNYDSYIKIITDELPHLK